MDYNYYLTLKNHYASSNVSAESKDDIIAELQTTMQSELDNNYITDFDIRIGMPRYKRTATVNFVRDIIVALKDERFKEPVYDSLAMSIYTYPDQCDIGDYITIAERGINETYLVRANPDKRQNHDKLMLLQCQNDVKILDDDGVTIHNYPMFFQDNKSRPGLSERSETGVTENSTFQAYVRFDSISRRFIDVTGKTASGKSNKIARILINGIAYKLTGDDAVTMGFNGYGLITLGLEKSTTDANDNLDLGIADYYNNLPTETPTGEILCDYPDLCISETNTYTIVTNNTVTWGLSDNGVIATLGLTGTNGVCTVTCPDNVDLIGEIVTLTAYLDYGATVTKDIPIVALI